MSPRDPSIPFFTFQNPQTNLRVFPLSDPIAPLFVSFLKLGRYSPFMGAKKNDRTDNRRNSDVFFKVPVKKDISSIETETISRAERTISTIDNYLAKVGAAGRRGVLGKDLFPQIVRIRHFRNMLDSWRKEALSMRERDDERTRASRLQEFVLICNSFSGV